MRGFVSGRSRAEPFWARRIRQDCDPKTYMYMSSGRKDGEAARPERRARLPETKPHVVRQTSAAQKTSTAQTKIPIFCSLHARRLGKLDRKRAVVKKTDFHVSTETAGADALGAKRRANVGNKALV